MCSSDLREPSGLDGRFGFPCHAAVLALLIAHHLPFHGLLHERAYTVVIAVALHGVGAGIGLVVFELTNLLAIIKKAKEKHRILSKNSR